MSRAPAGLPPGPLARVCRDRSALQNDEKALTVDAKVADRALNRLEVDGEGFDSLDRRYLSLIAESFGGGPVGIETIAAALSEPRDAIEEIVEPFLIQQGLVQRTPRGRMLSNPAFKHLGLDPPVRDPAQMPLFNQTDDDL